MSNISKSLFEVFCSLGVAPMVRVEDGDDPINKKIAEQLSEHFSKIDEYERS